MGNWDETKARLKEKISALTDGNRLLVKEELLSRLAAKLGETREVVISIISKL
jgi:hypothetical protein